MTSLNMSSVRNDTENMYSFSSNNVEAEMLPGNRNDPVGSEATLQ